MKYGLPASTIDRICGVFEAFPEVERAILYGSRAKGNFKRGSDIDLTLVGSGINQKLLSKIETSLDDLLLPYTIDLSIYDNLQHADLREHIERVGLVFYNAEVTG